MSSKIIQRKGDPLARKKANDNASQIAFLKAEYTKCQERCKKAEDEHEYQKDKLQNVSDNLLKVRDELSAVEEEIDCDPLPEGAQPKTRLQKRDSLKLQISQLEAAVFAQKAATKVAFEQVSEAGRKLFLTDKNLSQFVDALKDTETTVGVQEEFDKLRSQKLARLEERRAQRWESEQKAAIDARATQLTELVDVAARQIAVAKVAHSNAASRVNADLGSTRSVAQQLQENLDEHILDRTRAILELKDNISLVRSELVTQSDRKQRKISEARQQLENEKESLLSKGLNPYAEFRRKELNAEASKLEAKLKQDVDHNKKDLERRMEKEEATRHKEDSRKLIDHEHEKRFRDSQGRWVVEEKNRKYITTITIGAKEVLDPTGRAARVDPSQVTEIPDGSFGIGKSNRIPKETMAKITEKIRTGVRVSADDLGEYQRLVNALMTEDERHALSANSSSRQLRASGTASFNDNPEGGVAALDDKEVAEARRAQDKRISELKALAPTDGLMPGVGPAAASINLGSEADKAKLLSIAAEEAGGDLKGALGFEKEKSPKYKLPEQSRFEQDSFARAKETQKQRLEHGTVQIAGGRVFQGQSFVAKPATILFKDFVVGKKYKKVFTLTNASYTFNSFKLLPLSDDIIDFFLVTYEKPGRVSAGVSCSVEIVFSPQINKDIFSYVKLQTETGPVEIPLTCLIKRCAPRLQETVIDFGSVVIGQKLKNRMHIIASEALDTTFCVQRVITQPTHGSESIIPAPPSNTGEGPVQEPSEESLDTLDVLSDGHPLNEAELNNRVRRVLTDVARKKKIEDPFPLSFQETEGFVCGYDKASMEVICAPLAVGEFMEEFFVEFDGVLDSDGTVDAEGKLITRHQSVTLKVKGEQVPIYLEDVDVNMKCTLFGRIYRQRLEVKNRGGISYRLNISVPSPLNKYVEINPVMLFVQAKDSQSINIKFSPTADLIQDCAQFALLYEQFTSAALMAIPVKLDVRGLI
jgi:hypothetical protein